MYIKIDNSNNLFSIDNYTCYCGDKSCCNAKWHGNNITTGRYIECHITINYNFLNKIIKLVGGPDQGSLRVKKEIDYMAMFLKICIIRIITMVVSTITLSFTFTRMLELYNFDNRMFNYCKKKLVCINNYILLFSKKIDLEYRATEHYFLALLKLNLLDRNNKYIIYNFVNNERSVDVFDDKYIKFHKTLNIYLKNNDITIHNVTHILTILLNQNQYTPCNKISEDQEAINLISYLTHNKVFMEDTNIIFSICVKNFIDKITMSHVLTKNAIRK